MSRTHISNVYRRFLIVTKCNSKKRDKKNARKNQVKLVGEKNWEVKI